MKNRRNIILINKRFQITLIVKFLVVNVFILALFGIFLFMFLNSEVEANLYSAHVNYQNMKDMLFPIVLTLSILNILISSALITSFVLYASFRIAGPIYRFQSALNQIIKGNLTPLLNLRDKDELDALSETLQELTYHLNNVAQKTRSITSGLIEINQEAQNEKITEKINELDAILKIIKH